MAVTRLDFGSEKRLFCATHLIEQAKATNDYPPAALDAAKGKAVAFVLISLAMPQFALHHTMAPTADCLAKNRRANHLNERVIMRQRIKVIVEDCFANDVQRQPAEEVLHFNWPIFQHSLF